MKFTTSLALAAMALTATALPCDAPTSEASTNDSPSTNSTASTTANVNYNTSTNSSSTTNSSSSSGSSSGSSSSSGSAADGPVGYASQNGGTTGGAGGTETTVSDLEGLIAAATAEEPTIVYVKGTISGNEAIEITSDTSIIGLDSSAALEGIALSIKEVSNVIVRNLAISKVLADTGDAVGIQVATNVWIDHMDLSSDMDNGKDYYDGLLDITHGADYITVSNTKFHDHYKASLVGHTDDNAEEDTGKFHVTYANNHWANVGSRGPSVRFGTAHIFNSYYDTLDSGVNTRMGAKVLVESSVFTGTSVAIQAKDSETEGTAEVNDLDLGGAENTAPEGSFGTVPYEYELLGHAAVEAAVVGTAGNTLTF